MRLKLLLFLISVIACANACIQNFPGYPTLRSIRLSGRITHQQQPIAGIPLSLYLAKLDKDGGSGHGHEIAWQPELLSKRTTDANGRFDFGDVASGKYVMIMENPSHEVIAVDLVSPDNWSRPEQMWIDFSADYCQTVRIEPPPKTHVAIN